MRSQLHGKHYSDRLACAGTVSPPGKESVCIYRLGAASNQQNARVKTPRLAVQEVLFVERYCHGCWVILRQPCISCGSVLNPGAKTIIFPAASVWWRLNNAAFSVRWWRGYWLSSKWNVVCVCLLLYESFQSGQFPGAYLYLLTC